MLQTLEVKLKSTDSIQALEFNTSLSTKILSSVGNVFSRWFILMIFICRKIGWVLEDIRNNSVWDHLTVPRPTHSILLSASYVITE